MLGLGTEGPLPYEHRPFDMGKPRPGATLSMITDTPNKQEMRNSGNSCLVHVLKSNKSHLPPETLRLGFIC